MKRMALTCVVAAATFCGQAQFLFSPEAFGGAAIGAMIGGIAGGNSYYNGCGYYNSFSGEGAAIGAGIGFLAGALVGEVNRRQSYPAQPVIYTPAPAAQAGYGYSSAYVYEAPNSYTAPGYYYRPNRPNYAVSGTLLGAASGALIGYGASDKPGEGAAIGAAAGLLLGGLAEHAARKREQPPMTQAQSAPLPQAQAAVSSDQSPPSRDRPTQYEITSQPCPTSTFRWTAAPQIPDAPRVPDAPRF